MTGPAGLPPSWIAEVRARLEDPPPKRLQPSEARQAAVLLPLYVEGGQLWTVLTKRTETLPQHRGQVAFAGGGSEAGEDPWAAALREAEEEIGLAARTVLRLGQLDELATPSGFRIVPCVGAVPYPLALRPNPDEIEEVFTAPLAVLADPNLVEDREVKINGRRRTLRIYHYGRWQIWGATARMLQGLLARLGIGDPDALGE
jgi:8-oxo-dGTP pyrophosphatase MutT (NUDIX family)